MSKEETVTIDLLHRAVPAKHTDEGLRALSGESPIRPESVQKYLESKFGDILEDVSNAMLELARPLPPAELAGKAYPLHEKFRPEILSGKKGWGAPASWTWAHPQDGFHLTSKVADYLVKMTAQKALILRRIPPLKKRTNDLTGNLKPLYL
jgi:hypothetical protein